MQAAAALTAPKKMQRDFIIFLSVAEKAPRCFSFQEKGRKFACKKLQCANEYSPSAFGPQNIFLIKLAFRRGAACVFN
jgi:hypothetical protein